VSEVSERLLDAARQVAEVAADTSATMKDTASIKPWMRNIQGVLRLFTSSNGALKDEVADAIRNGKDLGELQDVALALLNRTRNGVGGDDLEKIRHQLAGLAAVLERVATSAEPSGPTPTASQAEATPRAETFRGWRLTGEILGRGGQGEVALVVSERTLERGALKRMAGSRAITAKGRERFLREIQTIQGLRHPHVVRVLDAGEQPELYHVTPVAAYGSLQRNRPAFVGDVWRCLRLIRCVALGLAEAHAKAIVHRDVKPGNILLESCEHPVIADFGIAHFADKETITSVDSFPGAKNFAPPEWDEDNEPAPTFDVFSLGAVLHAVLADAIVTRPYRKVSSLPPVGGPGEGGERLRRVDALIARMTAGSPSDRPQTMREVVHAIDATMEQLSGPSARGPDACTCGGKFLDVGAVHLGPGTEINVYPKGSGSAGGFGLQTMAPRLERCVACGVLRLRGSPPAST
jgi:Protein kinase domain